jgi:hypothetical protein
MYHRVVGNPRFLADLKAYLDVKTLHNDVADGYTHNSSNFLNAYWQIKLLYMVIFPCRKPSRLEVVAAVGQIHLGADADHL